jgi:nucleoside-diphosphate-sugar epimerase
MNDLIGSYHHLLEPSVELIEDVKALEGNVIILGIGGKMGPDLGRLLRKAFDAAGLSQKKVIGISRFSDTDVRNELEAAGVETISADLLNDEELSKLPMAANVIYMAGNKFGTTGKESFTWAMNTYLPGRVAEKYKASKIVVFSSGNIYPFLSPGSGGATEKVNAEPVGEYAQSCLGRERIFQYHSLKNKTPVLIYRLNYANDVTYGVLVEIARAVWEGKEIDLSTGNVNVIWQGDANEYAIRSLLHCGSPAKILNIAGPETVSVKWLAEELAELYGKKALFRGEPESSALLNNAAESFELFGYPKVSLKKMIRLVGQWVEAGGKLLNKPTHFQERKGKF